MKHLLNIMAEKGMIVSFSEGKRLITQGAVKVNGMVKDTNDELQLNPGDTIEVGKRKFLTSGEGPVVELPNVSQQYGLTMDMLKKELGF